MTNTLGRRLVILGGSIAGCFASAALSEFFDQTLVFERDELPPDDAWRRGAGQGSHIHGLMRRPFDIACELLPGFEEKLVAAGGLKLNCARQIRYFDHGSWHPVRDLGVDLYAQSRPLLEHVLRECCRARANVEFIDQAEMTDYLFSGDVVTGVLIRRRGGEESPVAADLVIDCTGRNGRLATVLSQHGYEGLRQTELGVRIGYTSACFTRTSHKGDEAASYVVRSKFPRTRSGVISPIENDRWIVSLSGRFSDYPPTDIDGFMAFAESLEHPILHDIIRKERPLTSFSRWNIPRIFWRRFEQMPRFPDRVIPMGDAVCVFNPVYGQGMSVAASHAFEVRKLLATRRTAGSNLERITADALPVVAGATRAAWDMTEPVDLVYDATTGERPEGYKDRIAFSAKVRQAMVDDAELHEAFVRVSHLIEPYSALENAAFRSFSKGARDQSLAG